MKLKTNPYYNANSLPSRMRRRRFVKINSIIEGILNRQEKCKILDIGGTEYYWRLNDEFLQTHGKRLSIVTVNLGDPADVKKTENDCFTHEIGDATDPQLYQSHDFDFIHSNSVIEHVGNWKNIRSMANGIVQSARPYFLQTPNFWFPIEPHFRRIGYQWLPESWRAQWLMRTNLGFRTKCNSWDAAMAQVESVKLLTRRQLTSLFPGGEVHREWLGPFVKSFMVIGNVRDR